FRDPEAFNVLRTTVFPHLFKDRNPEDGPVRIWIPGCSTGEEVYSIVIAVTEYIWEEARNLKVAFAGSKAVQIFATDISDISIDLSRPGPAETRHSHSALRAQAEWLSDAGGLREPGGILRSLHSGRQEIQDLSEEADRGASDYLPCRT